MGRIILSFEMDSFAGASVKYTEPGDEGAQEFSAKLTRIPHPDLTDILRTGLQDWTGFLLGFPEDCREIVSPCGVAFPKDGYVQITAIVTGPTCTYKVKLPKVAIPVEYGALFVGLLGEIGLYLDGKSSQLSLFGES